MKRPIRLWVKTVLTTAVTAVCFGAVPSMAQQDVSGSWSFVDALPYFPIHTHLLPTGKVMIWPGDAGVSGNDPRLWNPFDQSVLLLAKPGLDLFCSGHSFLSDGTLFVAGGHIQNSVGLSQASRYDPATDSWTFFPNMNAGRWYPTTTVLGNGDILVVSGDVDTSVGLNTLPQVLQLSAPTPTWRNLTNAQLGVELYPPMLLAPNGKVFNPGPSSTTRYLDTSGTGVWSVVAERVGGWRSTGSAVMYDSGKVLIMGGGDPPTNTAEVIDLNSPAPTWRQVGSMQFARRHLNATLLPDGQVLVSGGTSAAGFSEPSGAVYAAELWNPSTEAWTTLAGGSIPRLYHSAALLLLDGRVMLTGGNGYPDTEIYSPPYLYKGVRPAIMSAPSRVAYGQSFFVAAPDSATISKVTLLRLSSVTHSFNQSQYISTPSFSRTTGGLNITAPANGNVAPPGPYMLHIVNDSGVPSIAKVLLLGPAQQPADTVVPTVTMTAPSAGSTVSGIITLEASASDNVGIDRVDFYVDSLVVGSASRAPYQVSWDSRSSTNGGIALSAKAYDAAGNSQGSASVPVTVSNAATPAPTLTSLSPTNIEAGGASFTVTVNGTDFLNGSTVRWNGVAHATIFMSATQVTASISADDIATVGTAQVTVINPDGSVSNASAFTIANATAPVPSVASISPNTAGSGGPRFTLTVDGSNFVTNSVVRWNGTLRTTTYVNSGRLTAAIPAGDIALVRTAQVTVASPGGGVSNASTFTITDPVADTEPPTVTITAPTEGSIVSGVVTLSASAYDNVGVARVDYYVNTTMVGSASNEPYRVTWDSRSRTNGNVAMAAKAYDAADNYRSSANVFVTIANGTPPTVSSLSPNSATAGGAAFTLTVNGTNFVSGASVRWNGAARTSTFVSATQLTAAIAAADIAASGTAQVTVANPDGGVSNASTFTIGNPAPAPTVSSLSPSSTTAGGAAFTLTVNGTNFVSGASVRWNGAVRASTFVSATQLTSAIAAADIAASGTAQVTVANPDGGVSNANTFTIAPDTQPPTVTITAPTGGSTVSGVITLSASATDNVGVSRVDFYVNTTLIGSAGNAPYQVTWDSRSRANGNVALAAKAYDAADNYRSSANVFVTIANGTAPTVSSLSPSSTTAGGAAFTLTVNGGNFVNGASVRWNGAARTSTFVSATQLTAAIAAADIAASGTAQVTVANPDGGVSNASTFTISNPAPAPTVSSLSPNSATAGGAAFTLTVNGTNFVSGASVRWNGAVRASTFVSATQLTAAIAAADIAASGTAQVTVANPDGGVSNASTFTISNPAPAPTVSSLSPNSATAGGAAFTLTVNGTNFVSGASVRWNGAVRASTFVSATQLTAAIAAADIAASGTAQVTVANPDGGVSNASTFTISNPAPAPTVSSLSPNSATAGGVAFTLTVNGTNFVSGASVRWNGAARTSAFVSGTQLTAAIAAADIAASGTAQVTVANPDGGVSNASTFTISNPAPAPTVSSLSPNSATAGGAAFTLAVNGGNFVNGASVRWNGSGTHERVREWDAIDRGDCCRRHRGVRHGAGHGGQS